MVDPKRRWRQQTEVAARPVPARGLRLRDQTKHFAIAAPKGFRRHSCARIDFGGRSLEAESGWNFSLKRSWRSVSASLRAQDSPRFNGKETDLRNLSRSPNPRLRVRRIDI